MYEFKKDISNIMKEDGVEYVEIIMDNKEDYYKMLDELCKFNSDSITIKGTSRNPLALVLENNVEEISDSGSESDDK